jgi:hypothetical protein
MKAYSNLIWQWKIEDGYFVINPVTLEFEYNPFTPEIYLKLVVMGIGFEFGFRCPWETAYSKWGKEMEKYLLTLGGDLLQEHIQKNPESKIDWCEYEPSGAVREEEAKS